MIVTMIRGMLLTLSINARDSPARERQEKVCPTVHGFQIPCQAAGSCPQLSLNSGLHINIVEFARNISVYKSRKVVLQNVTKSCVLVWKITCLRAKIPQSLSH